MTDDGCTGEGRGRGHTYTASEVKVLTEEACKVAGEAGRRIGRAEALEEVAAKLDQRAKDALKRSIQWTEGAEGPTQEALIGLTTGYDRSAFTAREIARGDALDALDQSVHNVTSQPSGAVSEPLSGVPGHQEVSEAVRSPQEPPKLVCRRCNGYGLLGVAAGVNPVPCPDCAKGNTP